MEKSYDIIVIGGGHAGCEAAMAAANLGRSVLLISMDMLGFAKMSCNPAIGGIAKGQIVKEIDALGGYTGIVTDATTLQFRMLNKSKGPAMWSPRAQCDKIQFSLTWRKILESCCKLDIYEDLAVSFLFENSKICGVRTNTGAIFKCQALILTAGTFLGGKIFIGRNVFAGGRIGEKPSTGLTEQLAERGVNTGRMKTGTPPRIDISSVDVSRLAVQFGDENPDRFSFLPVLSSVQKEGRQMNCYILHTNERVHDVLRSGFKDSPLFTGIIHGKGPRYCPSIEDKLRVFPENNAHQLFLEPEGRWTNEYYLQGFSSSLPLDIQIDALHCIEGLENVRIFRPAYAVEYDYFDPTQLKHSLESKIVKNLFFAGQVNGTTGYEEAAGQGLMAGINAHINCHGGEPLVLGRDEAYIGVLIDDLVTKGVDEPYRMFTSRAEYRILLRMDDADMRLTPKAHEIGLADQYRYELMTSKKESIDKILDFTKEYSVKPESINTVLEQWGTTPLRHGCKLMDLIIRPQVTIAKMAEQIPAFQELLNNIPDRKEEILEAAEIQIKYSGYIERERFIAEKVSRLDNIKIKGKFNYNSLQSLSTEARQKLTRIDPVTIGQASRIPGVSPSDINVLLVLAQGSNR